MLETILKQRKSLKYKKSRNFSSDARREAIGCLLLPFDMAIVFCFFCTFPKPGYIVNKKELGAPQKLKQSKSSIVLFPLLCVLNVSIIFFIKNSIACQKSRGL